MTHLQEMAYAAFKMRVARCARRWPAKCLAVAAVAAGALLWYLAA
jgi:hypothetical protein